MTSIGNRLKYIRKKLSLTQKEFADSLGMPRSTLATIEVNKVRVSTPLLIAIENIFLVDRDWLVTGEGEPFSKQEGVPLGVQVMKKIPVLGQVPMPAPEDFMQLEPKRWIYAERTRPQSFASYIEGNTLEPEFNHGDAIIIDPLAPLPKGSYVLIEYEEEITIAKVCFVDNTLAYQLLIRRDNIVTGSQVKKLGRIIRQITDR